MPYQCSRHRTMTIAHDLTLLSGARRPSSQATNSLVEVRAQCALQLATPNAIPVPQVLWCKALRDGGFDFLRVSGPLRITTLSMTHLDDLLVHQVILGDAAGIMLAGFARQESGTMHGGSAGQGLRLQADQTVGIVIRVILCEN
jgi:hypothetical protein